MAIDIGTLLRGMVQFDASDLHLKVGSPPGYRVHGQIQPLKNVDKLRPDDTAALAQAVLGPERWGEFERTGDFDCAYSIPGVARFRMNIMRQRGSVSMVFRKIPAEVPSFESLRLPDVCRGLAMKPRGLVLVTGPAGSGKSTTLAAMVDYRNTNGRGHILTVEDPVEFVHQDKMSIVNQREIGADTRSFATALRCALRQDSDVILTGDMRDTETISLGLTAAETGRLVFGTLHTSGASQTIDRLVDVFPADHQQQVRVQLAETLQGIISQVLIPKLEGGRVAAHEILVATDPVRACIRDGKSGQIPNILQTGAKFGMQMLDNCLVDLVKKGLVSVDEAASKAHHPDAVKRACAERTPTAATA